MNGKISLPKDLPRFTCELGKSCNHSIHFINPLGKSIDVYASSSNTNNFKTLLDKKSISPYESLIFKVIYEPSSIKTEETSLIKLESSIAGTWEYTCSGKVILLREIMYIWFNVLCVPSSIIRHIIKNNIYLKKLSR